MPNTPERPALPPDQPKQRQKRLSKRLREINARGEQELATIMDTIEKIKARYRSGGRK
jgi:hypothetical protein